MALADMLRAIDAQTARAFVTAMRSVIDALLIETARVRQMQPPGQKDYNTAGLPREPAPGGWLSDDELRATAQRMSEAIATERWVDGLLTGLKLCSALGGMA